MLAALLLSFSGPHVFACDASPAVLNSIVSNGDGTYTVEFNICFAGSNESNGPSHGIDITITGANITGALPPSLTSTNGTTITSSITGGTVSYGTWNDTTTNFVEHPEVVADRLKRVAEVIGDPTRVLAGTDCGFDTSAGWGRVAEDVVWAKLKAMRAGAELASARLF